MVSVVRMVLFVAVIVRVVVAVAALAAMCFGIYIALNSSVIVGFAWIVGSIVFGFIADLLIGLMAVFINEIVFPIVSAKLAPPSSADNKSILVR